MRLAGITIDGKHTYTDWNLGLCKAAVFPLPKVNSYRVPISGGNGFIDYTESLIGEPTYSQRTGTLQFLYLGDRNNFQSVYSSIGAHCHGKTVTVKTDERTGVYFTGNISVGEPNIKDKKIKFNMTYTLQPFALENSLTTVSDNFSNATDVTWYTVKLNDVSGQSWNTDLRARDGLSLSMATGFQFAVPTTNRVGTGINYAFYDANGNGFGAFQNWANMSSGVFGWSDTTIDTLRNNLSSHGVDYTNIARILLRNAGGCTAQIKTTGLKLEVTGCDRTIVPIITLPKTNMLVECNGQVYTATSGSQVIDGLTIPRDGCTIMIGKGSNTSVSGTCSVKYRKEWL